MKASFKILIVMSLFAVNTYVLSIVEERGEIGRHDTEDHSTSDHDYERGDDSRYDQREGDGRATFDIPVNGDSSYQHNNDVGTPRQREQGEFSDGSVDWSHDTSPDVPQVDDEGKVLPTNKNIPVTVDENELSLNRINEEMSKASVADIYVTLNKEVADIMMRGRDYLKVDIKNPDALQKIKAIMKKELETLRWVLDLTTKVNSPDVRFELGRVADRIVQLKEFLSKKEMPEPLRNSQGKVIEFARDLGLHAMLPDEQRTVLRGLYESSVVEGKVLDAVTLHKVIDTLQALRLLRDNVSLDPALEFLIDRLFSSKHIVRDPAVEGFVACKIGSKRGKLAGFLKRLSGNGNGAKKLSFEESSMRVLRNMNNDGDISILSKESPSDFVQHTINVAKETGVDMVVDGPIIGLVLYEALPKLSEKTRLASEQIAAAGTLKAMGITINNDSSAKLDPKNIKKDDALPNESTKWWHDEMQGTARALADIVTQSKQVFDERKDALGSASDDEKTALASEMLRAFQMYQEAQAMLLMNLIQKSEEHQQLRIIKQDQNSVMASWFRDVFRAESKTKTFEEAEKDFLKNFVDDNQKQKFAQYLVDYTRGHISDLITIKNNLKRKSQLSLDKTVESALINALDQQIDLVISGLKNGNGNG